MTKTPLPMENSTGTQIGIQQKESGLTASLITTRRHEACSTATQVNERDGDVITTSSHTGDNTVKTSKTTTPIGMNPSEGNHTSLTVDVQLETVNTQRAKPICEHHTSHRKAHKIDVPPGMVKEHSVCPDMKSKIVNQPVDGMDVKTDTGNQQYAYNDVRPKTIPRSVDIKNVNPQHGNEQFAGPGVTCRTANTQPMDVTVLKPTTVNEQSKGEGMTDNTSHQPIDVKGIINDTMNKQSGCPDSTPVRASQPANTGDETFKTEKEKTEGQDLRHKPTNKNVNEDGTLSNTNVETSCSIETSETTFSDWKEALLLIESPNTETFRIVTETAEKLAQINYDLEVSSIIGPYRSGKSYLMNQIASKKAFGEGKTTKAETHGIWVLCLKHPRRPNVVRVLMDSEGFGDVDKGDKEHDDNIFLLNVLLSSTLMYNSLNVLDAETVDKLEYVARMAEYIQVTNEADANEDDLATVFPIFIWVVREFKLEPRDKETPDEYLESALERKKGRGAKVARYNSTRDCITKYFPGRKCFLIRPREEHGVQKREQELIEYLLLDAPVKQIGLNNINGKGFVYLAETYSQQITEKASICIYKAWGNFLKEDLSRTYRKAVKCFDDRFTLAENYDQAFKDATDIFVANKCYDVRYLTHLVIYMMKRKDGTIEKGNIKDLAIDVAPGGTEVDKEMWQGLMELFKGAKGVSNDLVDKLFEDRKNMESRFSQRIQKLETHFRYELRNAEAAKREQVSAEYEEVLQTMDSHYKMLTENFSVTIANMEALKEENTKLSKKIERIKEENNKTTTKVSSETEEIKQQNAKMNALLERMSQAKNDNCIIL